MKLKIDNLTKFYNNHAVLDHINLSFEGTVLALLGPSGGGKSTFLRVVSGLICPDEGTIELNDQKIEFTGENLRKHLSSIGTVFQSWNLFPHLTALENITLPLHRVHNLKLSEAKEKGMELLQRFQLENHAHKKPGQLSGGQCQRVAIVRAVAIQPEILLFDEPTSALDPIMTSEVLDLIAELKSQGSSFLLVSHHMSFVRQIADSVAFLSHGKLVEQAPTSTFFTNPIHAELKDYLAKVLKY
jgi:polar amino acid transport system ATP-binding protein